MMRKTILMLSFLATAILIGCSEDDSNNNQGNNDSNQNNGPKTFTEKYNGIVWIADDSNEDDKYYIAFYDEQPISIDEWEIDSDGKAYCDKTIVGIPNQDGDTIIVIENTLDNLLLEVRPSDSSESVLNIKCSVSNNGNNLTNQDVNSSETIGFVRSSAANPCR